MIQPRAESEYAYSLLAMRHGKTPLDVMRRSDGWLDLPLSDDGRMRLITAQQYLKMVPLTKIYAPDFARTMETAKIIASGVLSHPKVITSSEDAKTWDLGILAGTSKKENRAKVQRLMDNPTEAPEGGEPRNGFRNRFIPWFDARKTEVKKGAGPILLVMSGSNFRELSNEIYHDENTLDLDEGGFLEMRFTENHWKIRVLFGHKNAEDEWLS